jgi:Zn-finger nucleic acid-binding protein
MPAQSLNCPNCGGAVSSDAVRCQYCGAKLATISCASCFGLNFVGAKFCAHCGKALSVPVTQLEPGAKCPRCARPMEQKKLEGTAIVECPGCTGIWINAATFDHICANQQEQASLLGMAPHSVQKVAIDTTPRYLPCPECGKLMNRLNFAGYSGIILDLCRPHGLWFDRDELRRIIEFIRGGGMDLARQRERRELDQARRSLEEARQRIPNSTYQSNAITDDAEILAAFKLAGGLIRVIFH